jgi:hypothetical protein
MSFFNEEINGIYEGKVGDDPCYVVEHLKSGQCACFDHDPALVEAIKAEIDRRRASIIYHGCNKALEFGCVKGESMSLATFLYAQYEGIPLEEVRKHRVNHIDHVTLDNGMEDCRSINLSFDGGIVQRNKSRSIERVSAVGGRDVIKLSLLSGKSSGVVNWFDYDPQLYRILATPSICAFGSDGNNQRIVVHRVNGKGGIPVSRLAYAYYAGLLDTKDVKQSLKDLSTGWNNDRLEVDHVNGDHSNNCKYNLSLISKSQNSAKRNATAWFFPPFNLYLVINERGEYLIDFVHGDKERFIRCVDVDTLNDCLFNLLGWSNSITKGVESNIVTPESVRKARNAEGITSVVRDFEADDDHAIKLLEMDEREPGRFRVWHKERDILSIADNIYTFNPFRHGICVITRVNDAGKSKDGAMESGE